MKRQDAKEVVAAKVNYVLDEFRPNLPNGVEIIITQDRTGWSSMMVGELEEIF